MKQDKVHILLIHQSFAALNEPGGTRHYELARYLSDLGCRFTVIASPVSYLTGKSTTSRPQWSERQDLEGVTIYRTYTYTGLHRSFFHRVLSFLSFMLSSFLVGLKARDVDIVWGTSPSIFQGATAWALAKIKRARFLFEVRDLWPAFAVQVGVLKQPILIRASEWLERFLYRQADHVVVNSPGFLEHVRSRGARNVSLVANGADPRMFNPEADGSGYRKQIGLEGKFIALYAGAHGLSNDLDVVLQAAGLLQDCPDIAIVFLGDGKEKAGLISKSEAEGLKNVIFLPSIPKAEMPGALAASDACIAILKPIPLYKTVYPNKVFDYMAAGRPVLLAIDGVIREVVEEAGAGVYTPPGDPQALANAIRLLRNDPFLCKDIGQRGRAFVEEHFDRAVLAERLRDIFLGLIDGKL